MSEYVFTPQGCFALEALSRPAPPGLPNTPMAWGQEFEVKVLEELRRMVPAPPVPVIGVMFSLNGDTVVRMRGFDTSGHWRQFRAKFSLPQTLGWGVLGDPKAMAEIVYQVACHDLGGVENHG